MPPNDRMDVAMREDQSNRPMPRIVVSESDHERLTGLATDLAPFSHQIGGNGWNSRRLDVIMGTMDLRRDAA